MPSILAVQLAKLTNNMVAVEAGIGVGLPFRRQNVRHAFRHLGELLRALCSQNLLLFLWHFFQRKVVPKTPRLDRADSGMGA